MLCNILKNDNYIYCAHTRSIIEEKCYSPCAGTPRRYQVLWLVVLWCWCVVGLVVTVAYLILIQPSDYLLYN